MHITVKNFDTWLIIFETSSNCYKWLPVFRLLFNIIRFCLTLFCAELFALSGIALKMRCKLTSPCDSMSCVNPSIASQTCIWMAKDTYCLMYCSLLFHKDE